MAAIFLRSPVYKTATAGAGTNSTKCTITIDSVLRYTLVKPTSAGATILFEIAELVKDYTTIEFSGNYLPYNPGVVTVITSHTSTDGSGSAVATTTFTDKGFEGYGTFMEGANWSPTVPTYAMSYDISASAANQYNIFVPIDVAGFVPIIPISGGVADELTYLAYTETDTQLTGNSSGKTLTINRINCTKYGIGQKITFLNKYGALQDIWFFLKKINTTNKSNEQFQRNIISASGSYGTNVHTKQIYNTTAQTSLVLSSGYYPEWTNQWFEELLLSEYVWWNKVVGLTTTYVPVNVSKNSMVQKTSLNERLIDYTFEFEMAFDYINNVR